MYMGRKIVLTVLYATYAHVCTSVCVYLCLGSVRVKATVCLRQRDGYTVQ